MENKNKNSLIQIEGLEYSKVLKPCMEMHPEWSLQILSRKSIRAY